MSHPTSPSPGEVDNPQAPPPPQQLHDQVPPQHAELKQQEQELVTLAPMTSPKSPAAAEGEEAGSASYSSPTSRLAPNSADDYSYPTAPPVPEPLLLTADQGATYTPTAPVSYDEAQPLLHPDGYGSITDPEAISMSRDNLSGPDGAPSAGAIDPPPGESAAIGEPPASHGGGGGHGGAPDHRLKAPPVVPGVTGIKQTFMYHRFRWTLVLACGVAAVCLFVQLLMRCLEEDYKSIVGSFESVSEWLPSALVFLNALVAFAFLWGRVRQWFIFMYTGCFMIIAGGFYLYCAILSLIDLVDLAQEENCAEQELIEWNDMTLACTRILLSLWPLPFVGYSAFDCFMLSRPEEAVVTSTREKTLRVSPHYPKLEHCITGFTMCITCLIAPRSCRKELRNSSIDSQHIYHHVVQVFYEVILLVVACLKKEYFNLVAIVTGLSGSACGVLAHFFLTAFFAQCDVTLNFFAMLASIFIMSLEINHFRCLSTYNAMTFLYLFLFSVVADTIRLNSVIHGYVQIHDHLWLWLHKQATGIATHYPRPPVVRPARKKPSPAVTNAITAAQKKATLRIRILELVFGLLLAGFCVATCLVAVLSLVPALDDSRAVETTVIVTECYMIETDCSQDTGYQREMTVTFETDNGDICWPEVLDPQCYLYDVDYCPEADTIELFTQDCNAWFDLPDYPMGLIAGVTLLAGSAVVCLIILWMLHRAQKKVEEAAKRLLTHSTVN
ncbi:hypothetical protein Pelo_9199 [Pelomyxa schiedti]|nr:hypothetical protein Pelo_9199 [Pelomyxa schiedti]